MIPTTMKRSAAGAMLVLGLLATTVAQPAPAATAKANATCARVGQTTRVGTTTLSCTKVGTRNRWRVASATTVAPTTIAPVTTSAPVATAAPIVTSAPATTRPILPLPADADANGILKIATSLEQTGGLQLDPRLSVINVDDNWLSLIYGNPLRPNQDGTFDEWLAKQVDIVDNKTIRVQLNPGIVFSDGAPYDAQALRDGMLRTLNTPSAAAKAGHNTLFKETASITVDNPLQLTIRLTTPVAGEYLVILSTRESAVPSPKALAANVDLSRNPVGAGPFVLSDYRPSQILSVRKSPTFFQKDRWRLGGIDFLHSLTTTTNVSGLLAGTVQFAAVGVADLSSVESANRFGVNSVFPEFSYILLNFCSTKPPFDNIKVRQAVQAALNKNQINDFVFRGRGKVGYGFWPENSINFNPNLKTVTAYDPDKAKRLLAESGVRNVTFDLYIVTATNYGPLAELMQAQLEQIGIKMTINPVLDIINLFYVPKKPGAVMIPGSRPGVDKINRVFQQGSVSLVCDGAQPQITSLAEQIAALKPGDAKSRELWKQIDQINADNAWAVFIGNVPRVEVYNKNEIGGEVPFTPNRAPYMMFENLYIKK